MEAKKITDWPAITMYGCDFRKECNVMYNTITEMKLWDMFAQDPGDGGYTFSSGPWDQVCAHPDVDACGHSGYTQAYCLRIMQHIATKGWDSMVEIFEEKPALNPVEDFMQGTSSVTARSK
jgi:hypothetical protein